MLAIIGGTGLTKLANLNISRRQVVRTPYGDPSGALTFGEINGNEVVFLARHGYGHTLSPHEINYRANLWALAQQKLAGIVSVASVGGIRADLAPGKLIVPEQIIDYTWGRKHTYFEGTDKPVTHVDFTQPFSVPLREMILSSSKELNDPVLDGGVYACTQGPRLETAAEIRRLESDGADMVGMTGMPEACLARELGVPYAMLAVVANWAAGKNDSTQEIHLRAANEVVAEALQKVHRILECMSGVCTV
ncbi:MAG: methylthioadenosine phosphorylase [Proteobacteria bacterium]|nr:methylthioadenosine phosphorylase [Pseudomonadota bacterium]